MTDWRKQRQAHMKRHRALFSVWLLPFVVGLAATVPTQKQAARFSPHQPIVPRRQLAPPPPILPKVMPIDGRVQAAKLVYSPLPVYPAAVKKAGIQGAVILEILIGKDGRVKQLHYVSGPPRLARPSMEAVRQWRYRPTLLNGEPVEVDTAVRIVYRHGENRGLNPELKTPLLPPGRFLPRQRQFVVPRHPVPKVLPKRLVPI